jgi:hypothetical protein
VAIRIVRRNDGNGSENIRQGKYTAVGGVKFIVLNGNVKNIPYEVQLTLCSTRELRSGPTHF